MYKFAEIPVTPFEQEMFDLTTGKMETVKVESVQICVRSDNPAPACPQIQVGPYWVYVGPGIKQMS